MATYVLQKMIEVFWEMTAMIAALTAEDVARLPARERIVETAMRLFYRDGLRATGIDRLIAESGVAKMSFYRHFPAKSDLVVAFLEERHRRWLRWFDLEMAGYLSTPGQRLPKVADALAAWFAHPEFRGCAFINAAAEIGDPDSREYRIAVAHKQALEQRLVGWAGEDGCADPAAAGRLALIIVEGAIVRAQMTSEAAPAKDARRALELIVGGA